VTAAEALPAVTALAGVVVLVAVAVAVRVAVLRRRAAAWEAAAGLWWEITAPARPTPGASVAACQAIGGVLRRTHRRGLLPPRVALEFLAAPTIATDPGAADESAAGVRVAVWVPPRMPGATLIAALRAALPGAVIAPAETGSPWPAPTGARGGKPGRAVSVVELSPQGGVWAPLIDPTIAPRTGGGAGTGWAGPRVEAEPLRAVLAALARCAATHGPGEVAGVQLVVRAAPAGRSSFLGAGGGGVGAGLVQLLGRAVSVLALELLDIFTPGRPPRATSRTAGEARRAPVDPVQAAAVKAHDAKRAAGPHLAVTLRVAVATAAGAPEGVRRARLAAILGGYDLVTTPLHTHPRRGRRAAERLAARLPGTWFMATTAELAALWHLPTDPARHGLSAPPARDITPPPVLPRLRAPFRP
jgi:hypothetical protein